MIPRSIKDFQGCPNTLANCLVSCGYPRVPKPYLSKIPKPYVPAMWTMEISWDVPTKTMSWVGISHTYPAMWTMDISYLGCPSVPKLGMPWLCGQ